MGIFADCENLHTCGTIGRSRLVSILVMPGDHWSKAAAKKECESPSRRLLQRLRRV